MKYYLIDESYTEQKGYWHCIIGGAVIKPEDAVSIEFALLEVVKQTPSLTPGERTEEFKFTSYFRAQTDDVKVGLLERLCGAMMDFDMYFLLSHASCRTDKLKQLLHFQKPQGMIQTLAYSNVSNYLVPETSQGVVQLIVDLGLSESFRPIYDMYVGMSRGVLTVKLIGIPEDQLTLQNFRNLPVPLFIDSKDSRLLQLSDVLIGLRLAEITGSATAFKKRLAESTRCLNERIVVESVEWNAESPHQRPLECLE